MWNEQLLLAETIAEYIKSQDWLNTRDQRTLAHLRNDACCVDSPIGEHRCNVQIVRSAQSGLKPISCDTCLQDEIYDLNIKKGIVTIGSCCGHGRKQGFIQVAPQYVQKMHELGYVQLPVDENGFGQWCFKPKTFLLEPVKISYKLPEPPKEVRDDVDIDSMRGMIELTTDEADSLLDLLEIHLIQDIRDDVDIDSMQWLYNIMSVWEKCGGGQK